MSKLLIVSNRLPVNASLHQNAVTFEPSVGGLATGISSLDEPQERQWFGWPGLAKDRLSADNINDIAKGLKAYGSYPVHLSSREMRDYYFGFSNKTIWPLFHYFTQYAVFEKRFWQAYQHVNRVFCDEIVKHARPGDKIWVHDYQLMLLPQMLRQKLPDASIGFFLHIPFPTFELMRLLPWRGEILSGLLGADLIGFHEYDYVRHFISSVYRIHGHEPHLNQFVVQDRLVQVDAFPMGIDYQLYAQSAKQDAIKKEITRIRRNHNVPIILSVDRLDYTKGILLRLEAFDSFLSLYPEYRGRVTLVVVAVPSRTKVEVYDQLRQELDRIVGRINGEYGTLDWTPVSYLYRSLPFDKLTALYNAADVALITPLRDGMNLVSKEFVACQQEKEHQGMLILSEMAGASCEMAEAIVINPYDKLRIAASIKQALEMPQEERLRRNRSMQDRLSRYTVQRWSSDFIHRLDELKKKQDTLLIRALSPQIQNALLSDYENAQHRLLLLDYDGTLSAFTKEPDQAGPDAELLSILDRLCDDPKNEIVIASGRDRQTLTQWLGTLAVSLIAEHGAFVREPGGHWSSLVPDGGEWKSVIRPVLELYVDRTPGSFVEEKNFSLVWHCRKSDPELAKLRMQELKDAMMSMTANLNLGVFEGNKIVEIKLTGVNKGAGIQPWLARGSWQFILAAGDDYTDEDMFYAVGNKGITCKIGPGASRAQYRVNSVPQFRNFLKKLTHRQPLVVESPKERAL